MVSFLLTLQDAQRDFFSSVYCGNLVELPEANLTLGGEGASHEGFPCGS